MEYIFQEAGNEKIQKAIAKKSDCQGLGGGRAIPNRKGRQTSAPILMRKLLLEGDEFTCTKTSELQIMLGSGQGS